MIVQDAAPRHLKVLAGGGIWPWRFPQYHCAAVFSISSKGYSVLHDSKCSMVFQILIVLGKENQWVESKRWSCKEFCSYFIEFSDVFSWWQSLHYNSVPWLPVTWFFSTTPQWSSRWRKKLLQETPLPLWTFCSSRLGGFLQSFCLPASAVVFRVDTLYLFS